MSTDGNAKKLARFRTDRRDIVAEVGKRLSDRYTKMGPRGSDALSNVLNDAAFFEIKRLSASSDRSAAKQVSKWQSLATSLRNNSLAEKQYVLAGLVHDLADDIAGDFSPHVFSLVNNVLPPALSVLFTPIDSLRDSATALGNFDKHIRMEGAFREAKVLSQLGTLIVAPTHSSHMDSILIGFALRRAGLPAVTYGAGKNLFTNPLLSYFMNHLGAYKVDRRLGYSLYKDVLKEYSTILLERGYHSLFFPGGTRGRSGKVEEHLKLGLLGTGLRAYSNQVCAGAGHKRVFVVPVTINYRLVLEAETLIEDYLAESGKARYIISDDEFSKIGTVLEFARKTLAHEGGVVIRFGNALDLVGNPVLENGLSQHQSGEIVDVQSYMLNGSGTPEADEQRDAVYTQRLGDAIIESFRNNTVLMSTHLVCAAVYAIVSSRETTDIYKLVRLPPSTVTKTDVLTELTRLCEEVNHHAPFAIDSRIRKLSAEQILNDAARSLSTYHTEPVLVVTGAAVRVRDMKLLFYYQNRLAHLHRGKHA